MEPMMLHNCRGDAESLGYGIWWIHDMAFVDNGFGDMIRIDLLQMIQNFISN